VRLADKKSVDTTAQRDSEWVALNISLLSLYFLAFFKYPLIHISNLGFFHLLQIRLHGAGMRCHEVSYILYRHKLKVYYRASFSQNFKISIWKNEELKIEPLSGRKVRHHKVKFVKLVPAGANGSGTSFSLSFWVSTFDFWLCFDLPLGYCHLKYYIIVLYPV